MGIHELMQVGIVYRLLVLVIVNDVIRATGKELIGILVAVHLGCEAFPSY